MSTLLVLRTSVNGDSSFSNQLLDEFIAKSQSKWLGAQVIERDLNAQQVPMLNSDTVGAIRVGVNNNEERRAAIALSDELIAELKNADYLAIGLPRYNFTAPATFKSYIDYIGRAGITFSYTEKGPQGLLPNIPVYIFVTGGGEYADTPNDTMVPWLRQILGFLGLTNLHFVYAEGLAYKAEAAMAEAGKRIDELTA
ncbi:FMN-dependent NADH-azoreductase [Stenoxybacter acetivorans]|uniref:FMN-dependent NADH-azoreductase n=1 Tax=Stenoxybacter acetivorans TaxID=422441 RepID=UPI00055A775A|nr:NAD(P)H-dependent oxidoreductase [Stenoxybacter acetivorans]